MTLERIDSKEIGQQFKTLVSSSFFIIASTFAYLKALENLFKDNERLQIFVTGLPRTLAASFRNLPGSLSMPAGFEVLVSPRILST